MPKDDAAIEEGATATAAFVVRDTDLASHLALDADETFPRVFATSRMVALMELAAARLMLPLLGEGELSVGVDLAVSHAAPTPPGATVTATARFTGMEGKLYAFEIVAEDDAGEIGRGAHRRAIVENARLIAAAAKRSRKP
jgi:fluoroacetyl-CoA thioesterase